MCLDLSRKCGQAPIGGLLMHFPDWELLFSGKLWQYCRPVRLADKKTEKKPALAGFLFGLNLQLMPYNLQCIV